jgi:hypothetical protein
MSGLVDDVEVVGGRLRGIVLEFWLVYSSALAHVERSGVAAGLGIGRASIHTALVYAELRGSSGTSSTTAMVLLLCCVCVCSRPGKASRTMT